MQEQPNLGALLAVLAGIVHGSWALPMKRLPKWKWENMWLVYSIVGLIVVPLALALATVPSLGDVYRNSSAATLGWVALFGFGWGLGSILFGLGISRLGMALGFSIILGITNWLGALLPLLMDNPGALWTRRGAILLVGLVLVVCGIVACAMAGAMRDRQKTEAGAQAGRFLTGLIICIVSGVLSPMLNIGFVFGKPVQDAAVAAGARADLAANAIWFPALAAGFVANAGYAVYLLGKNRTWPVFGAEGTGIRYYIGSSLMGVIWFGGIATYGVAASVMGRLGPVAGWPVFMSAVIVTANLWGALSGEWAGAGKRARQLSWLGIAILIAAITIISQGT